MSDEILRWENRITRKPHKCFGCGKVYPPGSQMAYGAYKTAGPSVYGVYWCKICEEYMSRYFVADVDDGVSYLGEIRDGDPEGWEALRSEMEEMKNER